MLFVGISLFKYMDLDLSFIITFPIVVGVSFGFITMGLPHKQFSGIYLSVAPDMTTSILIKRYKCDGSRRFDDDVIYHFILYLRKFDPILKVIE
jgi:hypothetical protein